MSRRRRWIRNPREVTGVPAAQPRELAGVADRMHRADVGITPERLEQAPVPRQTVTRPGAPDDSSALATRSGRRRSCPLRSSISSVPGDASDSRSARNMPGAHGGTQLQRSQRWGWSPPSRSGAPRGGRRTGGRQPRRAGHATPLPPQPLEVVAGPVGDDERRGRCSYSCARTSVRRALRRCVACRTTTPASTIATPATTSITKWLAVATTATTIAAGPATASARSSRCPVAWKTTMPSSTSAGVEARHRGVLVTRSCGSTCR